jgi:monofunctional biosynthetic peptidoglycan transglycosylase
VFRKLALGVCAAIIAATAIFYATLPDVRPLAKRFPKTTAFMERRRESLAQSGLSTRLEWRPVALSRVSPAMQRAVVVAEDARFWEHNGVDWDAIRTAALNDWDRRRVSHGGSTITQQLAKDFRPRRPQADGGREISNGKLEGSGASSFAFASRTERRPALV